MYAWRVLHIEPSRREFTSSTLVPAEEMARLSLVPTRGSR